LLSQQEREGKGFALAQRVLSDASRACPFPTLLQCFALRLFLLRDLLLDTIRVLCCFSSVLVGKFEINGGLDCSQEKKRLFLVIFYPILTAVLLLSLLSHLLFVVIAKVIIRDATSKN
jgi:hypothetical protein